MPQQDIFCTLFLPSRIKKYQYLVYNSQKFLRVQSKK